LLPSNYRSGKAIIAAANAIVHHAHIEGLEPTDMVAMREEQGTVRVICAESLDDEANEVANAITKSVDAGDSKLADHTVLYRTNAQSRGIEEALLNRRVPYIVVGGTSFYDRKEVRDLLAYLRLAAGRGRSEDIKRSINTPFRFLGAKFVERVMDAADPKDADQDWVAVVEQVANGERLQGRQRASARELSDMLRTLQDAIEDGRRLADDDGPEPSLEEIEEAKPSKLLEAVVSRTKYIDYLNKEEGSESTENSGAANVREMIRVAERFPTADDLLDYIDDTLRKARQQREDKQSGGERVLLMSVHRSKGLEWPFVYVIGMNEMILPHVKGDPEEERRIAYVAATRARDVLTLSYVRRIATRAGIKEAVPSRFLRDTGLPLDMPRDKHPLEDL
jgi:DNA helicase-2/ATP-dependent DNA helicase PcrA